MIAWIIAGIVILLVVVGIIFLLFGPLASWSVAEHKKQFNSGQLTAKDYADILTNTRDSLLRAAGGVILLLGAVGTVGTLVYTVQTTRATQNEAAAAQAEVVIGHDGQVTDRYATAVDQLAAASADERIGGIYALERVMRDSHKDQATVVEVLTVFVREHSGPRSDASNPSADIQAALTVIARRNPMWDSNHINLSGAYLYNAELEGAHFAGANLSGGFMGGVQLQDADLRHADLGSADLSGSDLSGAVLNGANLGDGVDFSGATLMNADLRGANVRGANFAGANLTRTNLQGVDLRTAHGLTKQQISSARINNFTELPAGA